MVTQRAAKTIAHSGVDGGRSHGRVLTDDTRGMTASDVSIGTGDQGAERELIEQTTPMALGTKAEPPQRASEVEPED